MSNVALPFRSGGRVRFRDDREGAVMATDLLGDFPVAIRRLQAPGQETTVTVRRTGKFTTTDYPSDLDVVEVLP